MLQRHKSHRDLHWIKDLNAYYNRPEWELYDLKYDPDEVVNVAEKHSYRVRMMRL